MARVFVVQRPAYFDPSRQGWVNKYDLSPAEEHGDLIFLLKPGNIYRDAMQGAIERIRETLDEQNFTDSDHILAIGDPVAIAASVMIAAKRTGGKISLLKYDRNKNIYNPYTIAIS